MNPLFAEDNLLLCKDQPFARYLWLVTSRWLYQAAVNFDYYASKWIRGVLSLLLGNSSVHRLGLMPEPLNEGPLQ